MKIASIAFLLALVAAPASAQRNKSQHPRVGNIAELVFQRGSDDPPIGVEQTLTDVVTWAEENPDGLIVLDGHGDLRGNPRRNITLSLRRAKAIRAELVRAGVEPDRIVVAAYGHGPKRRRVVIWGTRAGMDAVIAHTMRRGHAVIWNGLLTEMDRRPQPGAASRL